MKYTDRQQKAIYTQNGTVLVSAAAGSGKTSVLAKRIAVLVENGADIRRMLVMTFTNAAAAEMRRRISRGLYAEAVRTGERRMMEQAELVDSADISTFHSFCAQAVRDNYDTAGVSPNFRIADEAEAEALRNGAMREYFDILYEKQDADFLRLLARYTKRSNDVQLMRGLMKVYGSMMGQPDPYAWALTTAEMGEAERIAAMKAEYGGLMLEGLKETIGLMRSAHEYARLCSEGQAAADKSLIEELCVMLECAEADIAEAQRRYAGMKIPNVEKGIDPALKERIKSLRKDARAGLKAFLEDEVYGDFEGIVSGELAHTLEDVRAAVEMIRMFDNMYSVRKTARNVLDYEDLQHKALRVLRGKKREYGERYDHIFVDEYQDTNPVQEEIISLVHGEVNNLFMVGDIKQSIYKFRLADPGIFRRKAELYRGGAAQGEIILMNDNFRSSSGVIDTVNFIMGRIMCERLGEIEYGEDEKLEGVFDGGEAKVLLCECGDEADGDAEEDGGPQGEDDPQAVMIAESITDTLERPLEDRETGKEKRLTYGDVAVLMRSRSALAANIKRELEARGVPCMIVMKETKDTPEAELFVNLLRLVENPLQDIPLLSVMRSFIGGFDENDFVEIRLFMNEPDTPFFEALGKYAAAAEGGAAARAAGFLGELAELSSICEAESLVSFISYIAERYDFRTYLMGVDGGNAKLDMFERLLQQMADMTEFTGNSLYRLLCALDEAKKRNGGYVQAAEQPQKADCVRIMTIHGSKGLEFPVVYLAGMERKFNMKDLSADFLTHSGHGLTVNYVDAEEHIKQDTVERKILRCKMERESRSEELRMLYVAMTRARDRLFLTGRVKDLKKAEEKWGLLSGRYEKAKCMLDWVMAANHGMNEIGVEVARPVSGNTGRERFDFNGYMKGVMESNEPAELIALAGHTRVPAKVSVSAVKKSEHRGIRSFLVPQTDEDGITGAHLGTLVHSVMERLVKNGGGFDAVAEKLLGDEIISAEEYDALMMNRKLAEVFLDSGLYVRMRNAERALFEQQFNMRMKAAELGLDAGGDMVVQGILDAAFMEGGEWVLLDYKTDRVNEDAVMEAAEGYRVQIDLYARALERITAIPVKERYLYFLRLGREIKI